MTRESLESKPEPAVAIGPRAGRSRVAQLLARKLALGRAILARLFDQRDTVNRRLTIGLGVIAGAGCLLGLPDQLNAFPLGNDIELPLRAASHWANGGQAYPASAMLVQRGPDLPYLYPPFLLPLMAPIAALPRDLVTSLWLILCLACAVWTCRRLSVPWPAVPFLLAWPPFAEGLIVGNVQIFSFAAFVALFYEPGPAILRPRMFLPARDAVNGLLAAVVGVFKITQVLPGLYLARSRLRAAVIGVAAVVAMAIAMLPLTGIAIYGDWLAQLQRAADPNWIVGGVALARLIGIPAIPLMALGIAITMAARARDGGAWIGIALIIATPSVHGYTFLFLLPGLLTIRRDYGIVLATLFLGVYHGVAWWLAWAIVVYLLFASSRWSWMRRPNDVGAARGSAEPEPEPAPASVGLP